MGLRRGPNATYTLASRLDLHTGPQQQALHTAGDADPRTRTANQINLLLSVMSATDARRAVPYRDVEQLTVLGMLYHPPLTTPAGLSSPTTSDTASPAPATTDHREGAPTLRTPAKFQVRPLTGISSAV